MSNRVIKIKEVCELTSLSKTTIYRRINDGSFPKPISLGPQRIAFLEKDVENWILAHIAGGQDND